MAPCAWASSRRAGTARSPRTRSARSSDCMDLRDRTVVILGGSGLVGHAVARRVLGAGPKCLVLVALFEDEVRAAASALAPHRGRTAIEVEWGNVFLPAPVARLDRAALLANGAHRRLVIRHMQIMVEALRRAGTQAYVKIGTSGTGGMGFNIPYTHSEERPSRTLLTKSAVAGAHSLLLFLMGRTPGAPATVEIKPTATIAWREIAYGPVRRKGKPIPLVDCPTPLPVAAAFRPGAAGWRETGEALDGAYIDVGENGLFARDEFATVTALGQMEFITPEEVADYVIMELEGRATGKDTVAALDAATAGPTYRAGILREYALGRLDALERERGPAVAYEMLGPPRLTKMLFEAHLCGRLRPSVRALAGSEPEPLAGEALALVEQNPALRRRILSVGLPIVPPDGRCVHRGSLAVVPAAP